MGLTPLDLRLCALSALLIHFAMHLRPLLVTLRCGRLWEIISAIGVLLASPVTK